MTYYVAMHTGFLCLREGRYFTCRDLRFATPFTSATEADAHAKIAVRLIFRALNGIPHYGIVMPALGEHSPGFQTAAQIRDEYRSGAL